MTLLRELVRTDFKLRYQGSVLGYLWSLMKPLFLFGVLYVVFVRFLRFGAGVEYFPVYLLLGVVLWTYFIEATNMGLHAIVDRGDLIRKVNTPKYIIVLSASFSALVNLFFNLLVVGIFMALSSVPLSWSMAYLPLIIFELFILSTAMAFFLSAMYVRFRDIAYIWEVVLQALFYATPIIYTLDLLPERAQKVVMLSPLAQIIQDARYVALTQGPFRSIDILAGWWQAIPYLAVAATVVISLWYFRKHAKRFAEDI